MVGYLDWCVDDRRAVAGSGDAMRLARSPAVACCTFSGTHHAYERFAFEFRISRRDVHRVRYWSTELYDLAVLRGCEVRECVVRECASAWCASAQRACGLRGGCCGLARESARATRACDGCALGARAR
jgi:hypothetical protein